MPYVAAQSEGETGGSARPQGDTAVVTVALKDASGQHVDREKFCSYGFVEAIFIAQERGDENY